jgi:archaellum component FlaC
MTSRLDNTKNMDNINKTINVIENKLDKLQNDIEILHKKMDIILERTLRSENHIDFVENTYETFKSPLFFIKDKINQFIGVETPNKLYLSNQK